MGNHRVRIPPEPHMRNNELPQESSCRSQRFETDWERWIRSQTALSRECVLLDHTCASETNEHSSLNVGNDNVLRRIKIPFTLHITEIICVRTVWRGAIRQLSSSAVCILAPHSATWSMWQSFKVTWHDKVMWTIFYVCGPSQWVTLITFANEVMFWRLLIYQLSARLM